MTLATLMSARSPHRPVIYAYMFLAGSCSDTDYVDILFIILHVTSVAILGCLSATAKLLTDPE